MSYLSEAWPKIANEYKAGMPLWMLAYETKMGSHVYGTNYADSDLDVYGFYVPLRGSVYRPNYIWGYDPAPVLHEQFDRSIGGVDFNIYTAPKYVRLLTEGNPNMIDSLFTPVDAVTHWTWAAEYIRRCRGLFVTKRLVYKTIAYAKSQLGRLERGKTPAPAREHLIAEYGFDTKYAYHLVRLLLQAEQLVNTGTMTLDAHGRQLRAIRQGEEDIDGIKLWAHDMVEELEIKLEQNKAYLPDNPDATSVRILLTDIMEYMWQNA